MTKSDDVIFRSKLPDIDIPKHLPIHSYCFQNISEFRTRPCLINGATDEIHTYEEVELTSRKVAAGLSRLGVRQGDTVMFILQNSPEFVYAFLGASYIGASSTMANPDFTPADVLKQARISGAKLIVTEACHVDKVSGYASEANVKVVCVDRAPPNADCLAFSELMAADEREMPAVEIDSEDVVALPYSSGTTGVPKGVMLTHKALVTNVAQQVDGENPNMHMHSEDVMLCVLPLYHMYSLNLNLLCGLRVGAANVIMHKFDIVKFLELIHKYKATIALLVPPIFLAIAKSPVVGDYDLSSVRRLMSGAAPLGKGLEDSVRAKFPNAKVGQGYGMTEGGPVLATCLGFAKEPIEMKPGSSGIVLRNTEMKIVDPKTGATLGRNQSGEVCCRGDQIMKGYLDVTPDSTQSRIDKVGWLHTDDIGFVDDDDELFIVDRSKEIIDYKGFQVAPAELEALLLIHPNIWDAAVVSMPDKEAGEVPIAFVVKCSGFTITEDDIKQFISKQVDYYKRINHVVFVDTIPKAPTGKILRRELRARVATGLPN